LSCRLINQHQQLRPNMNMTFLRKLHATRQLGEQRPWGPHTYETWLNQSGRTGEFPAPTPSSNQVSKSNLNSFSATDQRLLLLSFLLIPPLGFFKRMKNDGPASRTMEQDQVRTRRDPGTARSFIMTPFGGAKDIVLVYYASSCQCHGGV